MITQSTQLYHEFIIQIMMKNNIEENRLIAEFMGGVLSSVPNLINLPQTVGEAHILCVKGSECLPNGTYSVYRVNELQYHKSWDWLMEVVERINLIDDYRFTVYIASMDTRIEDNVTGNIVIDINCKHAVDELIESVYEAVVEFIKWHNFAKKTQQTNNLKTETL